MVSLHVISAARALVALIWSLIFCKFHHILLVGTIVLSDFTCSCDFPLLGLAKENNMRGKDANGETVLHMAASQGCEGSCRFLVEELGFDVNNVSDTGAFSRRLGSLVINDTKKCFCKYRGVVFPL